MHANICHDEQDLTDICKKLEVTFQQRGYDKSFVLSQINKAKIIPRNELLTENIKKPSKRIPLSIKYNRTMPALSKIINKHWDLLQIDNEINDIFTERPIFAYKRNKNLKDLIGGNVIENNLKVIRKTKENTTVGKCQPCYGRTDCLCCKQLKNTDTFSSDRTSRSYKILHNVNCRTGNLIYLMECVV